MQASGAFKGHLVTKKVKTYNLITVVLVIIENVTFRVEVLDVVVSKTFKVHVTCMENGCYLELSFLPRKHKETI